MDIATPHPDTPKPNPKPFKPSGTPFPANAKHGDHPQMGVVGGVPHAEKTTGTPGAAHLGVKPHTPQAALSVSGACRAHHGQRQRVGDVRRLGPRVKRFHQPVRWQCDPGQQHGPIRQGELDRDAEYPCDRTDHLPAELAGGWADGECPEIKANRTSCEHGVRFFLFMDHGKAMV